MTNPQKIEGGWRSRLTFDKDWNTLFIDGKEIVTKQQMVYFISDLLASERQRCVEALPKYEMYEEPGSVEENCREIVKHGFNKAVIQAKHNLEQMK